MRTETTIKALFPAATIMCERGYFGTVTFTVTYTTLYCDDAEQRLIDTAEIQLRQGDVAACFATLNTYGLAARTDRTYDFGF